MEENPNLTTLKKIFRPLIIASAIIWGAVIIVISFKLKGAGCYAEIQSYLTGGVIIHIMLISGLFLPIINKIKKEIKGE